jgi:cytochrome P450
MSVQETLCQITTFIAAGHETTASALVWCLYALSKSPTTQRKLRAALFSLPAPPPISPPPPPTLPESNQAEDHAKSSESPFAPSTATLPSSSAELQRLTYALSRLPYLDWVVRESLRLHSPVSCTMRVCTRETDMIPVAEPFLDRKGVLRPGITVSKGDIVIVPVQAVNKSRRIWGDDACEFR